jgi:hypothetical protein
MIMNVSVLNKQVWNVEDRLSFTLPQITDTNVPRTWYILLMRDEGLAMVAYWSSSLPLKWDVFEPLPYVTKANLNSLQLPALSERQLWTTRVSSTKWIQRSQGKALYTFRALVCKVKEWATRKCLCSYPGARTKKEKTKFTNSKMTDFDIFLEIRLISGQAFCSFVFFHAGSMWQRNRNYLKMSWIKIETFYETLPPSRLLA